MNPPTTPTHTALSRARSTGRAYPVLIALLCAAVIGLSVQAPLQWLVDHQGINILLVILIFAAAVTITVGDLRSVAAVKQRLALSLAATAGITVLPALAWLVSHVAPAARTSRKRTRIDSCASDGLISGPRETSVVSSTLTPSEVAQGLGDAFASRELARLALLLHPQVRWGGDEETDETCHGPEAVVDC